LEEHFLFCKKHKKLLKGVILESSKDNSACFAREMRKLLKFTIELFQNPRFC